MKGLIPPDVWDKKQALIESLYNTQSFKEVLNRIRSEHFNPSEKELRSQLKKWRVTKPSAPSISLGASLSELTKDTRDMEAWVRRSTEVRREAAQRKNKVVRPMNPFMLYRYAYAGWINKLFAKKNQRVISKIAGDSWKIETHEIREKFKYLANIEKINHLKAHPGHKFSNNKKNRPGADDEGTDLDDGENSYDPEAAFSSAQSISEIFKWESRDSTPFGITEHQSPSTARELANYPTQYLQQPIEQSLSSVAQFEEAGFTNLHALTIPGVLPGAAPHFNQFFPIFSTAYAL